MRMKGVKSGLSPLSDGSATVRKPAQLSPWLIERVCTYWLTVRMRAYMISGVPVHARALANFVTPRDHGKVTEGRELPSASPKAKRFSGEEGTDERRQCVRLK